MSLEWEIDPACGCHYQKDCAREGYKKQHSKDAGFGKPCSRIDNTSAFDHYEPREPALREDGIPEDYFNAKEDTR